MASAGKIWDMVLSPVKAFDACIDMALMIPFRLYVLLRTPIWGRGTQTFARDGSKGRGTSTCVSVTGLRFKKIWCHLQEHMGGKWKGTCFHGYSPVYIKYIKHLQNIVRVDGWEGRYAVISSQLPWWRCVLLNIPCHATHATLTRSVKYWINSVQRNLVLCWVYG